MKNKTMSLSLEDGIAKRQTKFAPHRQLVSWLTQAVCARLLQRLMQGLEAGSIRFVLPDGRELVCETGRTGPNAVMQFSTYAGIFRLSYGGYMGLGEGYLAGDWSTPSLRTVFQFGIVNQASLKRSLSGKAPARALRKVPTPRESTKRRRQRWKTHKSPNTGVSSSVSISSLTTGFWRSAADGAASPNLPRGRPVPRSLPSPSPSSNTVTPSNASNGPDCRTGWISSFSIIGS